MKYIFLLSVTWLLSTSLFAQVNESGSTFCTHCMVDLSSSSLLKYWSVYQIKPAALSTHDDAISDLEITGRNGVNSFSGMISYGNWNNTPQSDSCTLTFTDHSLQIIAKSRTWNGRVYKATGDSMIFGLTGQFMYYMVKAIKSKTVVETRDTITVNLRNESLIHNWWVYKVESEPGFMKPSNWVLRGLNITTPTGNMQFNGTVLFDNMGNRKSQDCSITFLPGSGSLTTKVFIVTDGQTWFIETSKADGKEMILGNKEVDGIRYFLKIK